MNTGEMLKEWGKWQRSELNHLKYSRLNLIIHCASPTVHISEDELMNVDRTMAKVKKANITLFNVLKWRFVYSETYRVITKKLHKRSPKVAKRYLDEAFSLFNRMQTEEV